MLGRALDLVVRPPGVRVGLFAGVVTTIYLTAGLGSADDEVRGNAPGPEAHVRGEDWYDAALARLEALPDDGPVLLVAASGGGARAAAFATLVLETLEHDELFVYGAEGAKPHHFPAAPARYVWLMSGVSGGSVATANYVAQRYGAPDDGCPPAPSGSYTMQNVFPGDVRPGGLPAPVEGLMGELLADRRVDESLADFNAPAALGLLKPWLTRGQALADYWNDHQCWNAAFHHVSGGEVAPLVVFNATLVESGRRLLIGEPPLPTELFANTYQAYADQVAEQVLDRARPLVLTELSPTLHPSVGDVVRMSASFPFGMDLARVPALTLPERSGADRTVSRTVEVGDGGMIDNTGTVALIEVLEALVDRAARDARAAEIVEILRRRGVAVVEIDSGAKPLPSRGVVHALLHPVSAPLGALSGASYSVERADVLERRLANPLGARRASWASFTYCPKDEAAAIMTAWGLGVAEKRQLFQMYSKVTLSGDCFRPADDAADGTVNAAVHRASPLNTLAAAFQRAEAEPADERAGLDGGLAGVAGWSAIASETAPNLSGVRAAEDYRQAFAPELSTEAGQLDKLAALAPLLADPLWRARRDPTPGVMRLGRERSLGGWMIARHKRAGTLLWSAVDVPAEVSFSTQAGVRVRTTVVTPIYPFADFGPTDFPEAIVRAGTPVVIGESRTVDAAGQDTADDAPEAWTLTRLSWDPSVVDTRECQGHVEPQYVIGWCPSGQTGAPDPTDPIPAGPVGGCGLLGLGEGPGAFDTSRQAACRLANTLVTRGASQECVAVMRVGPDGFVRPPVATETSVYLSTVRADLKVDAIGAGAAKPLAVEVPDGAGVLIGCGGNP